MMIAPITDSFEHAMQGLEAGLRVQHIATFDLRTCSISDSAAAVLNDPSLVDFDQIPVRDKAGCIVGVLNRTTGSVAGDVSARMQQLDESLLVPAEAPLISFIRLTEAAPYRLVLNENGIKGIITRSDLLKLPVRLLAFAFVTHLETLMANVIRTRYRPDDESWLALLSEGRRRKIARKRQILKSQRMEPTLLELTDFRDKREIVPHVFALGDDFTGDVKDLERLRNTVAHAGTFIGDDAEARAFAQRIRAAEKWIDKLQEFIATRTRE